MEFQDNEIRCPFCFGTGVVGDDTGLGEEECSNCEGVGVVSREEKQQCITDLILTSIVDDMKSLSPEELELELASNRDGDVAVTINSIQSSLRALSTDEHTLTLRPLNEFLPPEDARRRLAAIRDVIDEFLSEEPPAFRAPSVPKKGSSISELEMVQWLIRLVRITQSEMYEADNRATSAELRAEAAESALESATQPLAPEMARLNKRIIELTEMLDVKALGFRSVQHYEKWTTFAQQVAHVGHKASLHSMPQHVLLEEIAKLTASAFSLLTYKGV